MYGEEYPSHIPNNNESESEVVEDNQPTSAVEPPDVYALISSLQKGDQGAEG